MSYTALLLPCPYLPSNFAVSAVAAEINAELAASAAAQSLTTATAAQTAAVSSTTATAASATSTASTVSAASTGSSAAAVSSTATAFGSIALPVAISILSVLAAGMVIDIAKAQRELRRCHKLSVETVFSSRQQLIDALFMYSRAENCNIYEEADGSLIVRYQLQDYLFRMNKARGCFDLEIVNAQHPANELEKINQLQLCYIEAVRQHSYNSLMKQVAEQGWTIERNEKAADGSICISLLV